MREIKFRAWDGKRMWPSVGFSDSDCGRMFHEEAYMVGGGHHWGWDATTVLMQFTGLIDKNGKEIYEGDVVNVAEDYRSPSGLSIKSGNYEISFEHGRFTIGGRDGFEAIFTGVEIAPERNKVNRLEVIGNIYENRDLLNVKNNKE